MAGEGEWVQTVAFLGFRDGTPKGRYFVVIVVMSSQQRAQGTVSSSQNRGSSSQNGHSSSHRRHVKTPQIMGKTIKTTRFSDDVTTNYPYLGVVGSNRAPWRMGVGVSVLSGVSLT
jgi:hypothetical protein